MRRTRASSRARAIGCFTIFRRAVRSARGCGISRAETNLVFTRLRRAERANRFADGRRIRRLGMEDPATSGGRDCGV